MPPTGERQLRERRSSQPPRHQDCVTSTNCQQSLDGDVQGVQFIHFPQSPGYFFAMPAHHRSLMAFFAESHASVLAVLLNVMGV